MARILISETPQHINQKVVIAGWVHNIRDHGQLTFLDLRDSSGLLQVVINDQSSTDLKEIVKKISKEWVLEIEGTVLKRDPQTINQDLITGEIEVSPKTINILAESLTPPFPLDSGGSEIDESLRLKYRYLDIRRPRLQNIIEKKHKFILAVRNWFDQQGFTEVITPLLTSTSPEGARDFLVPSRIHQGKFFVLPQAPQQFKQLLMVGGINKYFQIAPCARDEDPRADRHAGVFYQIDIEIAFPTVEEIFTTAEQLMKDTYQTVAPQKHIPHLPFPKISYQDALNKYGSDKPDLRFALELVDFTQVLKNQSEFNIFNQSEVIKGIIVPQGAAFSKSQVDTLEETAKSKSAQGLAYTRVKNNLLDSGIARFFSETLQKKLIQEMSLKEGDLLLFVADRLSVANKSLGQVRNLLGDMLKLKDKDELYFCWVTDFPFYEINDEGKLDFGHNPFSMPKGGRQALDSQDPLSIESHQYDLVLNGYELASGSIRNHEPETLIKAFEILGYSKDVVTKKFGAMYTAFQYGAPPHGGWAIGLDRLLMLLLDEDNIRDVYAFPLSSNGVDLMMGAPSMVDKTQLDDVGLSLKNHHDSQNP